jgi:serine/threonine-protein kinase
MGIPFGRYELLKRIAAGGMGEVFLARQVGMQGFEKLLVVKVLLPHLVEDQEFVTMFFDEARIAARLNHPNVAQIFDLGDVEGSTTSPWSTSGDDVVRLWKQARTREKSVPLPLVARMPPTRPPGSTTPTRPPTPTTGRWAWSTATSARRTSSSPSTAGEAHRLRRGQGRRARLAHRTGTLKGKYSYMRPSRRGQGHRLPLDVFALGVVLYEMATSLRLFKRETEISTLKAVEACEIPRPSERNPEIDEQLEAVMMKALARDADAATRTRPRSGSRSRTGRCSSAPRLLAHLAAFMQSPTPTALAAERAEASPSATSRARRPRSSAAGRARRSAGWTATPATTSERGPAARGRPGRRSRSSPASARPPWP